jgi:hypothetical protein
VGAPADEFRPDTIRARVAQALGPHPERARSIAVRLGISYRQCVDALAGLHALERVERVGRKARALWRAQTDEEARAGAARRARGRAWGVGAGGEP